MCLKEIARGLQKPKVTSDCKFLLTGRFALSIGARKERIFLFANCQDAAKKQEQSKHAVAAAAAKSVSQFLLNFHQR